MAKNEISIFFSRMFYVRSDDPWLVEKYLFAF